MLNFYWQKNRRETMNRIIIKLLITLVSANTVVYGMQEAQEIEYEISREEYEILEKEKKDDRDYILKKYGVDVGRRPYGIRILPAKEFNRDEAAIASYLKQLNKNYDSWKDTQTRTESAEYCQKLIQQFRTVPTNLLYAELPDVVIDNAGELKELETYYREQKNKQRKYSYITTGIGLALTVASAAVAQDFVATILSGASTALLARTSYEVNQQLTEKEKQAKQINEDRWKLLIKTGHNQAKKDGDVMTGNCSNV